MKTIKEIRAKIEELEESAVEANEDYDYEEFRTLTAKADALKWVIYGVGNLD